MKKATIYAMFCSTVMFSGTLLAVDDEARITEEAKRKRQEIMQNAPKTPISEISQRYPNTDYTPGTRQLFISFDIDEARRQKAKDLREQLAKIDVEEATQRKELAEKKKEQELKERQAKQTALLEECVKVIEKEKETASQKQAELEAQQKKAEMLKKVMGQKVQGLAAELNKTNEEVDVLAKQNLQLQTEVEMAKLYLNKEKEAREHIEEGLQSIIGNGKGSSISVSSSLSNSGLVVKVSDTVPVSSSNSSGSSSSDLISKNKFSLEADLSGDNE